MPLTGPMSGAGLGFCTQTKELKGQAAAQELYVAQRTTLSGKPCRLPLIYRCNCDQSVNLQCVSLAKPSDWLLMVLLRLSLCPQGLTLQ